MHTRENCSPMVSEAPGREPYPAPTATAIRRGPLDFDTRRFLGSCPGKDLFQIGGTRKRGSSTTDAAFTSTKYAIGEGKLWRYAGEN